LNMENQMLNWLWVKGNGLGINAPELFLLLYVTCFQSVFSKTTLENIAVSVLAGRCEQKPMPT
jgi:hypothetical protein